MTRTRSTKGTEVYESADPAAAVTTLYVRKNALTEAAPKNIVVTIESAAA